MKKKVRNAYNTTLLNYGSLTVNEVVNMIGELSIFSTVSIVSSFMLIRINTKKLGGSTALFPPTLTLKYF